MKDFALSNEDDLLELETSFSLDELDDWHTSTGLVESAMSMIRRRVREADTHIFVHMPEAREYREIDREGLASIPDDSIFIACLAMCETGIPLNTIFQDYVPDDDMLRELLTTVYRGYYIIPVVHRFSLLAFIMLCAPTPESKIRLPDQSQKDFLAELTSRLRINLYAASIADQRQRELLRLAEYPASLHARRSVADLSEHLLDDLKKELDFTCGVYYEYEEYLEKLIPIAWTGTKKEPQVLQAGCGISGQVIERRRPLWVPDRSKHPSFAMMNEEKFIEGSFISAPIHTDKRVIGVVTLSRKGGNGEGFAMESRYTLEIAAAFVASEINNRMLYDELEQSYFSTVSSLTRALEAKDHYTRGHSERVMQYAVGTAHALRLSPEAVRRIRYAAILHDIGKIGISDSIITKTSSLTKGEFDEIKRHTEIGYDIVNENSFFTEIRDLIKYHHEKMDGTGYYAKHSGDYPWEAMIISVADIYDALTSDRPYRTAYTAEQAVAYLEKLVDVNFDRRILDAFQTCLKESAIA
ncbi:MAG: HD domain-containing protein [Spirochaetales bacterium]|nr:HD domain-containing protein [Spirochaetales bacterium]